MIAVFLLWPQWGSRASVWWFPLTGPIQGVGILSQTHSSSPSSVSWPQAECPEECSHFFSVDHFLGCPARFCLEAGLFGSCSSIQGQNVFSLFQARPSYFGGHMSQAPGSHGSGFCTAPRATSYEDVSVEDEKKNIVLNVDTLFSRSLPEHFDFGRFWRQAKLYSKIWEILCSSKDQWMKLRISS